MNTHTNKLFSPASHILLYKMKISCNNIVKQLDNQQSETMKLCRSRVVVVTVR